MSKQFLLMDLDNDAYLTFNDEELALRYQRAFAKDHNFILKECEHKRTSNAGNHIDWSKIPNHFNFIARDSRGVIAFRYLPRKIKYYGPTYATKIRYGGEWIKLPEEPIYELVDNGDIYERPNSNKHFINWNNLKGAEFIKFFDNMDRTIEIFDKDGSNIYIGSNRDAKIIDTRQTLQFGDTWFYSQQVYTFTRH